MTRPRHNHILHTIQRHQKSLFLTFQPQSQSLITLQELTDSAQTVKAEVYQSLRLALGVVVGCVLLLVTDHY